MGDLDSKGSHGQTDYFGPRTVIYILGVKAWRPPILVRVMQAET